MAGAVPELKRSRLVRRRHWEVASAVFGGNEYLELVTRGWEPFAVTSNPGDPFATTPGIVWFRKQAE